MKDVEQYIKPFNRFEMASGNRGVFLESEDYGRVVACCFERADDGCSFASNPLVDIGTDVSWRIVKIWKQECGGPDITPIFNYAVTPIWQEESEEQHKRRKQIEQLEETIKKAQQQIEQLKEEK